MESRFSFAKSPLAGRHMLLGLALCCLTVGAQAHPGHVGNSDIVSGFMHPLSGLDHLLAMLAVGAYAALRGGHTRWLAPLLFLGVLLAGSVAGHLQWGLPMVEAGIAASVLVLGLMMIAGRQMPAVPGYALIAGFALCHGFAHGTEASGSAFELYCAGFAISCLMLQTIGFSTVRLLGARHALWARGSGALVAATGLMMLVRVV
ncbi:MAG: HupE/UreJ family protein [Zoogloeaceae bacterium]|jgi:urease accessory protein|nr:HupE/UreJ family protein [Zoogloeaceae bacterium]